MAIDKGMRGKKRKKGSKGGALMLNIRVRHIRKKGAKPITNTDVRNALQKLLDTGRMPPGWQFMYVDWRNPHKHGSGWLTEKSTDDEEEFTAAFAAVVQHQIRMAQVRRIPREET